MIVELLTACAWIAWTPASGEPAGHYFYEDALPAIVAFEPEMEVCRVDWDVVHTYSVAGFTADGVGPESDDLRVVWPSEPIPEPDGVLMLLAGWVLITGLFYWKQRARS